MFTLLVGYMTVRRIASDGTAHGRAKSITTSRMSTAQASGYSEHLTSKFSAEASVLV